MGKNKDAFKYGTLVVKCHQCDNETILEDMVEDGRAVYLFNVKGNSLKFHCPECDITMEMFIKPSDSAPIEIEEEEVTPEEIEHEELEEGVTEEYIPYEELQEETTTEKTV